MQGLGRPPGLGQQEASGPAPRLAVLLSGSCFLFPPTSLCSRRSPLSLGACFQGDSRLLEVLTGPAHGEGRCLQVSDKPPAVSHQTEPRPLESQLRPLTLGLPGNGMKPPGALYVCVCAHARVHTRVVFEDGSKGPRPSGWDLETGHRPGCQLLCSDDNGPVPPGAAGPLGSSR